MSQELLIVTPDHQTRRVGIERDSLSLGRAHTNDLCYPEDASLSRRHLLLRRDDQGLWVEDLGSKNGTLLNGTRLTKPQRVQAGDRLIAGHLEITVVDQDQDAPVVFVPPTGEIQPQGTVMTRLADLLSGEATAPLTRQPLPPGPPSAESQRSAFDSPMVRLMLRAGRELASHRPLDELFSLILDLSIEAVGAERGVLLTLEGGRLVTKARHGDHFRISATVRDKVLNEKTSLLVRDMAQEEAFREKLSISAQQIHTMMAVPLQTEDRVIGLVYVDSRLWMREFTPDDLNMLTFLGNVAAIRIVQERLAQLERENEQAAVIQRSILPGSAPRVTGVDLAGHNAPCRTVGGDYYDFIPYPDGRVGVVLGDVAGKGMSAALMMSNLQARVQLLAEQPTDLGKLMSRLDQSLVSSCPTNRFITMFFSLLDPASGDLRYCNAGHNPPLLVRQAGHVDRLTAAGTVLGILPDLTYDEQQDRLEVGDTLVVFSDGVTEAENPDGEEFGEKRLAEMVAGMREQPAAAIVKSVLESLEQWTAAAPAADDVTLVIAKRAG